MSEAGKKQVTQPSKVFQFTLAGLIVFSLALVTAASLISFKLASRSRPVLAREMPAVNSSVRPPAVHIGPWGELIARDIELERPAVDVTEEATRPEPETWNFKGLNPAAVKALLAKAGLSAAQIAAVFGSTTLFAENTGTMLIPSADALLSLNAQSRQRLCLALAGQGVNLYLDFPYIFPGSSIEFIYTDSRLKPEDVAVLKRLVYANGNAKQLSDYELLLGKIPTVERRVAMAQALSRQSAVFPGLVIKPDTDVDKIAAYWGNVPNVRFTEIRPLVESLKALPEGGNLSLFYLLPKFARDRLYTFPLPPQPGDPAMDCHWSTFNFCNDTPDNRFNDPHFATEYIRNNFFQITAPSQYGDVLLLTDGRGDVKHSAVYLADDLVFTKNGNNYHQPWMIMHIPDLLATYPATPAMKPVYMRRKMG